MSKGPDELACNCKSGYVYFLGELVFLGFGVESGKIQFL